MEVDENGLIESGKSENVPSQSFDPSYTHFYNFVKSLYSDKVEKFQKSRTFPIPFFCQESLLVKLDKEANSLLKKLSSSVEIDFQSITRFQDLSILKIDSFDTFLEKAGNKNDPELVKIIWKIFSIHSSGTVTAGQIAVTFSTEKVLHTQDLAIGEFNHASMAIDITGSDLDWVEKAFDILVPFLNATKLAGIYKPLWLFRNKHFIGVASQVTSWTGFYIGLSYASQHFGNAHREKADYLKLITSSKDVNKKIELLSQYFLIPSKSLWYEPIFIMASGAVTYAVIYFTAMYILPRLTPSSHIAIGLASESASRHFNTYRFIVFTVIVSGIIIPLIFKLFGG